MDVVKPLKVKKVKDIGQVVRQTRKEMEYDQAKTAGLSGVGVRFLSELERGKDSVSMEKVLSVLQRLGLELWITPKGYKPNQAKD